MAKRKKRSDEDNEVIELREQCAKLRAQLKSESRDNKIEAGKKKSRSTKIMDTCPQCGAALVAKDIMKVNIPSVWVYCSCCSFTKTIDKQPVKEDKEEYSSCHVGDIWK
jgi:hypothetical protein